MTDNNGIQVIVGDKIKHRHHDYGTGTIISISDGCNAVAKADFGREFPTIVTRLDIVKQGINKE